MQSEDPQERDVQNENFASFQEGDVSAMEHEVQVFWSTIFTGKQHVEAILATDSNG